MSQSAPIGRRRFLAGSAATAAGALPLRLRAEADDLRGFPGDFVWGASTSAYQIEGAANEDGRGASIWDVFARQPGRIANGATGGVACDHYHRSREDIGLLARGGLSAYRFSVAWPRVLPEGTGTVNAKGLDFYDRLVDDLLAHNIAPWLCLYHWDLPQALQERGGWLNRDSARWFADYARIVAARLGDRVKHWVMFNEIGVHALFGHGIGTHAPGLTGWASLLAALHHQNLAQGLALKTLRADFRGLRLGTVMSLQPARPVAGHEANRAAAARFDALWNRACIDPLLMGHYPALLADDFAPSIKDNDLAAIRQPVDFLGLNYYSPMYIEAAAWSVTGAWFGPLPAGTPVTHMGWPIDPNGLLEQLRELRDRYGNPEVIITENGASFTDTVEADGTIRDSLRIAYMDAHLRAARAALREGCALRGYFIWSLLDNFEWAEGYTRRFGVVHVDFATQKRAPKASFDWLAEVIRAQR